MISVKVILKTKTASRAGNDLYLNIKQNVMTDLDNICKSDYKSYTGRIR